MRLISLWPWYSLALLFANIGLAITAGLIITFRGSLPRLVMLKVYLWYSAFVGLLGFAVAWYSPRVSTLYWHTLTVAGVGFDLILFLLGAELVDQLIRRDDVQRAKKLWLYGLPVAFCVAVIAHSTLIPTRCVPAMLAFDALAALISALCVLGTYITPDADWLPGYKRVVAAVGFQVVSMALMNLVYHFFRCKALDIASPCASLITLTLFLWASLHRDTSRASERDTQTEPKPDGQSFIPFLSVRP